MAEINDIQLVSGKEIAPEKWDALIKNSIQGRIYATTQWLDHFSPGWYAICNPQLTIAMPLPVQRKYGIAYLAQPIFTQQLGLFSLAPATSMFKNKMITIAKKKFPFAEMYTNESFALQGEIARKNYELPLIYTYDILKNNYSKSFISNCLKPASKLGLQYIVDNNINGAIQLYKELYQKKMDLQGNDYTRLKTIARNLAIKGDCFTRTVTDQKNNTLAISLFFKDNRRIYNICSATTLSGRKANSNYLLYDSLIQEFAETGMILDFEGSNVPGIEAFYKKFGAAMKPYYFIKWNDLKWPYKLFKK